MDNWIPFAEGEYLVEMALLVAENQNAVLVEDAIVEVYSDPQGQRYLKGRGRIRNIQMVELLDDSDDLDLLLDFGDDYKYLLKVPHLQSGKVFSPDVKSILQFTPQTPWQQLPPDEFNNLLSRLRILSVD
jgi:hypothetical protein